MMTRSKMPITFSALIAAAVLLSTPSLASAQAVGSNIGSNVQASWNTASSGAMSLRAPGNLVSLARADFSSAHSAMIVRSRSGPTIDQAADTNPTLRQQVLTDVISTTFDTLNGALLAILNSIRASAGLSPVLPGTGGTSSLTGLLGSITGTL